MYQNYYQSGTRVNTRPMSSSSAFSSTSNRNTSFSTTTTEFRPKSGRNNIQSSSNLELETRITVYGRISDPELYFIADYLENLIK